MSYALWPKLSKMVLLDSRCWMINSPANITITDAFDLKHLIKRLRSTIISDKRGVELLGQVVTGQDFRLVLELRKVDYVGALMRPKDKQNVSAAVDLLQHVAQLPAEGGFPDPELLRARHPGVVALLPVLRAFGAMLLGITAPITQLGASLEQLLVGLSKTGALAFLLYRAASSTSAFLPSVLYHDLQAFIQTVFWNVLRLQVRVMAKSVVW